MKSILLWELLRLLIWGQHLMYRGLIFLCRWDFGFCSAISFAIIPLYYNLLLLGYLGVGSCSFNLVYYCRFRSLSLQNCLSNQARLSFVSLSIKRQWHSYPALVNKKALKPSSKRVLASFDVSYHFLCNPRDSISCRLPTMPLDNRRVTFSRNRALIRPHERPTTQSIGTSSGASSSNGLSDDELTN